MTDQQKPPDAIRSGALPAAKTQKEREQEAISHKKVPNTSAKKTSE
jgi:hypothetical protein